MDALGNDDKIGILHKISKSFKEATKHPEIYLSLQNKKAEKIKVFLKSLYDFNCWKNEDKIHDGILGELVLEDMDEEQIWQQIELRNDAIWPKILENTSKLLTLENEKLGLLYKSNNEDSKYLENEDYGRSEDTEDEELQSNTSESNKNDFMGDTDKVRNKKKIKYKSSIVDDKFFKLNEMEEFLNAEDEKERSKKGKNIENDEIIDYFESNLSDDGNTKYVDFFDDEEDELSSESLKDNSKQVPTKRRNSISSNTTAISPECEVKIVSEDEEIGDNIEENNEEDAQLKSSYELRQERLKQRIEEFEENALNEKPWQLKGEIAGVGRPQNSLLQEILEFDSTTRPAPVITEETTMQLEDIIKRRIKDKAWDDVVRKFKEPQTPMEFRKKIILDQEKSKESLAQIYEKEYRNEMDKLNENATESKEQDLKEHKEIKELMKSLFIKLDALSNFHYTPKPIAPEPRIITNTPAIEMEEVAPVAVSDAKLLAPEEVKNRIKGDLIGQTERTKTDKKRERRKKKLRQKFIQKFKSNESQQQNGTIKQVKEKMLQNVIKNRNVQKINASTDGNSFKSSKSFFTKLQDKTTINGKNERKRPKQEEISAKRLKL